MRFVLADVSWFPLFLFWAAMMLVGRAQQARRRKEKEDAERAREALQGPALPTRSQARAVLAAPPRQAGLMDELRRAMDELKRAEMQQVAREPRAAPSPVPEAEARAKAYLEVRKRMGAPAPHTSRTARRSLFGTTPVSRPADDEGSLERGSGEETTDYDEESARVAEERFRAVASPAPAAAARVARTELPGAIGDAPVEAERKRPLARFADGRAGHAVILAEILGRPRWELPPDV